MVPSFITTMPMVDQQGWAVVHRKFREVRGMTVFGESETIVISHSHPDQLTAERSASAYAEQERLRHTPFGESVVSAVILGDPNEHKYVPIIVKSDGTMTLEGDGMAMLYIPAMKKAAEIAFQRKIFLIPPTRSRE